MVNKVPLRKITSRPILIIGSFIIAYAALELFSLGVYYLTQGEWFSFPAIRQQQSELLSKAREAQSSEQNNGWPITRFRFALHPYLGYVWDINRVKDDPTATSYGLDAERDPFVASHDPAVAIVGITGGSVAERMFWHSRDALRADLKDLPQFKGRSIVFIMLGMVSYHQPQQLMAVSYYLSLGGRLDMLINLDGKNEATVGFRDKEAGIYPAYPFLWNAFFNSMKPEFAIRIAEVSFLKQTRTVLARAASHTDFSVTASTLWLLADRWLEQMSDEKEEKLNDAPSQTLPYFESGPSTFQRASSDDIGQFLLDLWENSSLQLYHLASTNHFYYFHFLQPSQYFSNSKTLTPQELKRAYDPKSDHATTVRTMYPQFRSHIKDLRKQGVNIYDLTQIYRDEKDSVYIDKCCHTNQKGYDLLAGAIGAQIKKTLGENQQ